MKNIIGFTDSITTCECCGKSGLKGTYCLEIDGVELYYGSTCAFKAHGVTDEEQKEARNAFSKRIKFTTKLESLITESFCEHTENQIFLFVEKSGQSVREFLEKYGKVYDEGDNTVIYKFGSKVRAFDKKAA